MNELLVGFNRGILNTRTQPPFRRQHHECLVRITRRFLEHCMCFIQNHHVRFHARIRNHDVGGWFLQHAWRGNEHTAPSIPVFHLFGPGFGFGVVDDAQCHTIVVAVLVAPHVVQPYLKLWKITMFSRL